MEENEYLKFYETPLFIWSLLIIMPPLGILFLWIFKLYNLYLRSTLSVLFGLLYLNFLGMESSFIRVIILVLGINLLWIKNREINKHKMNAKTTFKELINNVEIETMLKNYLILYDSPTKSYVAIKQFEVLLNKTYPILYSIFTLSNIEELYINVVYHKLVDLKIKLDVEHSKMEYHLQNIKRLRKLISKKVNIGSEKLGIYFLWSILKIISIDYYADQFYNKNHSEFIGLNNKEAIIKYLSIDSLDIDINSSDRVNFTYFLMKYGDFKGNLDLVYCSNILEDEFNKQMIIKNEKEFELSLHHPPLEE